MKAEHSYGALVTGGSRGIGRAICLEFAGDCQKLAFFHVSNVNAAAETRELLAARGCDARSFRLDVADSDAVAAAFSQLEADGFTIDVLINCAGVAYDRTVAKLGIHEWNRVLGTNLTGTFNCSQAAISGMRARNYGRIVNISSIIGQMGNVGQANYAAAKAGLIGFTKSLALETASYDITVNAVSPGFIATDMLDAVPGRQRDLLLARIPKGRFGEPAEVARVVRFLAEPASSFITGQQFNVNGGMYL